MDTTACSKMKITHKMAEMGKKYMTDKCLLHGLPFDLVQMALVPTG